MTMLDDSLEKQLKSSFLYNPHFHKEKGDYKVRLLTPVFPRQSYKQSGLSELSDRQSF